jgi:ribonucleoside-diphosphate reductase alpha chain
MNLQSPISETGAAPISHEIWDMKYRFKPPGGDGAEQSLRDTFSRVARAVAKAEKHQTVWEERFFDLLQDMRFIPAGRILAGAGTGRNVTLFNCFVMGTIDDSIPGIFDQLKEAAQTLQQGGGIGHDFSTLRPKGAAVHSVGADASGPLSFMECWDAMCKTIMSAGARRGAMMGTLRCDHPDIEAFIHAKRDPARLRNFNLSVLVTDAFMRAVDQDALWPLVFDDRVFKELPARDLWAMIMQATYDCAEPGVIFIDRINSWNPLSYCETIACTNPCGEQPLPPYGACLLGSLNLTKFVHRPFAQDASLDLASLEAATATAIRFLDDVIEVSNYPLPRQRSEAFDKRRLGLGVTGLADALIMLGLRYATPEAAAAAGRWMETIHRTSVLASAELAAEKGSFPLFDAIRYLATPYGARLTAECRSAIQAKGLRNGLLTSIAPTGTISLLAGNVSSGIEPVFSTRYERKILKTNGTHQIEPLEDFAVALWHRSGGTGLPPATMTVDDLKPADHLRMQAAIQPFVDSSISKTVNVRETLAFDTFMSVYEEAYRLGLKGCTTFRPNRITGSILSKPDDAMTCASCGASDVEATEGCMTCRTCGFALCG